MTARLSCLFMLGVFWCGLLSGTASARALVVGEEPVANLASHVEYLVDPVGQQSFEQLVKGSARNTWQSLREPVANFGFTNATYWFRFTLMNDSSAPVSRLVEVGYPLLDDIEVYQTDERGQALAAFHTGDQNHFNQRFLSVPTFVFPLEMKAGELRHFYLRVKTTSALQVPLALWKKDAFYQSLVRKGQWNTLYFGVIVAMIIVNFFFLVTLRDKSYLWYIGFVGAFALLVAALNGMAFQYLWPSVPYLQYIAPAILVPLNIVFGMLFVNEFLQLKSVSVRWYRINVFFIGIGVLCLGLALILPYQHSIRMSAVATLPASVLALLVGPTLWVLGHKNARFFSIAWILMMLGTVILALSKLGVVPSNDLTEHAFQVGSALEAVFLTIALGDRFNLERKARLAAQQLALTESMERERLEKSMMYQASHHPRIGLPNGLFLKKVIEERISRHPDAPFALVIVHLGQFHEINKTLGYETADRLLLQFLRGFRHNIRQVPSIVRLEQTETEAHYLAVLEGVTFALMLNEHESDELHMALREILAGLGQPVVFNGMQLVLGCRMGVAFYPAHADDYESLVRQAQVALDAAQESGQKSLMVYCREIDSYNERRIALMGELQKAIETNALEMYFQPKLDLHAHQISGLEALLRWQHPQFGFVPPDEFVPLAEQTGIILPLTRWVVESSLNAWIELAQLGYDLSMSINVSAINLIEPDFVDFVAKRAEDLKVPVNRITLEVTETAVSMDLFNMVSVLTSLSEKGFDVSVDDFGTGYSSLAYIKNLPVSEIKIDKSLVFDMTRSSDNLVIVKTAVDMGRGLGYRVVAEGVEDEQALQRLESMACDCIQGYHLSKPLPLPALIEWLETQSVRRRSA